MAARQSALNGSPYGGARGVRLTMATATTGLLELASLPGGPWLIGLGGMPKDPAVSGMAKPPPVGVTHDINA